jgi:hypothetical protein
MGWVEGRARTKKKVLAVEVHGEEGRKGKLGAFGMQRKPSCKLWDSRGLGCGSAFKLGV